MAQPGFQIVVNGIELTIVNWFRDGGAVDAPDGGNVATFRNFNGSIIVPEDTGGDGNNLDPMQDGEVAANGFAFAFTADNDNTGFFHLIFVGNPGHFRILLTSYSGSMTIEPIEDEPDNRGDSNSEDDFDSEEDESEENESDENESDDSTNEGDDDEQGDDEEPAVEEPAAEEPAADGDQDEGLETDDAVDDALAQDVAAINLEGNNETNDDANNQPRRSTRNRRAPRRD